MPNAASTPTRRRSCRRVPAWLAAALVGGSLTGSAAQEPVPAAGAPTDAFFEVVEVSIANIDVWVTDEKGNPVDGLTAEDFVVRRDGEEVPIANFYAVSENRPIGVGGDPTTPPEAASPRPDESPAWRRDEEPAVAPEHRLWMIVYIDNFNVDPIERNRVFPQLRTFLRRTLRPGDQAMVVKATRSLEVVQPFTADGESLGNSLAELFDDSGHATVRRRSQIETLQRIDRARSADQALIYAQQYAEEQMNGVEYTAEVLERLIESLGGLPGRKALVHVSSGIPMSAGEEMFQVVGEKFDSSEAYSLIPRHNTSRTFNRVNDLANAHRVAFYTIDAGGMRGMEFGKAEYGGFVDSRVRRILDSVVHESLQAPLRLMAIATGGQAIVNQNEILPALEKVARDFRSFYSLGIASNAQNDTYHEVEVKLADRRGDLQLRHRAGYRSKTPDTRARESLRSALLYTQDTDSGGVEVAWGRAERRDDGNYELPIQIRIPVRNVVLLPTVPGKQEARLRLYFGVVGPDGEASAIESVPFGFRLADEHVAAAQQESILHTHRLVVDRGQRRIGMTVLDLAGGDSWVVTGSVQVGPAAKSD